MTAYAHFDGVSALPDGPPHCVRFHVDAEGRCGVMSRVEAAVNKIAIITTDDSHLLKFDLSLGLRHANTSLWELGAGGVDAAPAFEEWLPFFFPEGACA